MSPWTWLAFGIVGIIYCYGIYCAWDFMFGLPYMLDGKGRWELVKKFPKEIAWRLPWLGLRNKVAYLKRGVETPTPDRIIRQLRWHYEKTHRSSENVSEKRLWEAYAKYLFWEKRWKFWFETIIVPILWPFFLSWVLVADRVRGVGKRR